ncbi:unnamed protein product [Prunus armeniaca]
MLRVEHVGDVKYLSVWLLLKVKLDFFLKLGSWSRKAFRILLGQEFPKFGSLSSGQFLESHELISPWLC